MLYMYTYIYIYIYICIYIYITRRLPGCIPRRFKGYCLKETVKGPRFEETKTQI